MRIQFLIAFIGSTIFSACLLKHPYCKAQTSNTKYSFIKKEFNHLYFSKDSNAFLTLYKKFDRIKEGSNERVNVVHIGGSHVQGGTWSNTFITDLQTSFITSGGGYFAFPYRLAKTNEPHYYKSFSNGVWKKCRSVGKDLCLPLGMSAMNVNTNDSANYFGVVLTKKSACKYVNVVKVYHNFNESFEFHVNNWDTTKIRRREFKKFGYSQFTFDMPLDSVSFNLIRKDTLQKDFILFGMSLENDLAPGFYMAALGANGASSSSFLRSEKLETQLESLDADLFILSLGVNDTQSKGFEKDDYIENYDSLIVLIKKSNPEAAIILTTTTDNYIRRKTSNKRTITARDAMFELMHTHNTGVWDLFLLMGGYRSMPKWFKAGLAAKDKVHFTGKGYVLLGDMMFESLYKSYLNNQKQTNK